MEDLDLKKVDQVFRQQVHHCQELIKSGKCQDDLVLKALRASRAAVSLLQRFTGSDDDTNAKQEEDLRLALHNYTRSVLDSTYFQECALTGVEFRGDSPYHQIAAINKALSMPPRLVASPDKVGDVLGTELVECVYWRVGALLYMFCHSMYEGGADKRAQMDKNIFMECCRAGVGHLRLMLSARTPLGDNDDYVSYDADMVQLLQQGIFSDIHMLSLMYAGEMCYWAWDVSLATAQQSSSSHSEGTSQGISSGSGQRTKSGTSEVPPTDHSAQHTKSKPIPLVEHPSSSKDRCKEGSNSKEVNGLSAELKDDICAGVDKAHVTDEELAGAVDTGGGMNRQDQAGLTEPQEINSHKDQTDFTSKSSGVSREGVESGSVEASSEGTGESDGLAKSPAVSEIAAASTSSGKSPDGGSTEGVTLYNVMLYTRGQSVVESWKKDFDSLKHGVEMLSKYISVARGPLKKHGWNYSKAVELMVKLKKASMQRNQ